MTRAPSASAGITDTRVDAQGTLELAGSGWLRGSGVNVYSNGAYATNDAGRSYVGAVYGGQKWQCVELINRLYLARGWITNTWFGNGNTLVNSVPPGLVKQNNGTITYINPGDVVTLDDGGYGHAAIVNSVSGGTVQIVNQNTKAVYSTATFNATAKTLAMSGFPGYSVQAVIHAPNGNMGGGTASTNSIVIRVGSTLYAKASLGDQWTTLTGGSLDVKVAGTRIAYRNTNGTLYAKDGLGGTWIAETGAVDQYLVTPTLLIIRVGTTLYGKAGLADGWSTLATGVADVAASGSRIAFRGTNGTLYAKDGLGGTWIAETGAVDQYLVTPSLLIIRVGTTLYGKAGLTDSWATLAGGVANVKAAGNRIVFVDTSNQIHAKDGLGGTWFDITGAVDQYVVTPSLNAT